MKSISKKLMDKASHIVRHVERKSLADGKRFTSKRKRVLAALLKSRKAVSAYDLSEYCNKQNADSISVMSIYRILEMLQNESLVHKLKLSNKYVACAHILCDHTHGVPQFLTCRTCSEVKEISIAQSTLNKLNSIILDEGFSMASPQLEIDCLCKKCSDSATHKISEKSR